MKTEEQIRQRIKDYEELSKRFGKRRYERQIELLKWVLGERDLKIE